MGSYPKAKLVLLERLLLAQDEDKKKAKRERKDTGFLKDPEMVAAEFQLPVGYVRRYAWERYLDPFPGPKKGNTIWLAANAVVHLGYSVREAAAMTGFTQQSVENFLHRANYKRFVVWGRTTTRKLYIPSPFSREDWKMAKVREGDEQGHTQVRSMVDYFKRRRH